MATSPQNPSGGRKGQMPAGVRGPGGPPAPRTGRTGPAGPSGPSGSTASGRPSPAAPSPWRRSLEERSYPWLRRLNRLPRWIVVITPAALLFVGLVLSGPLAWLGGIILLAVTALLAWLTALSWPVITQGSRALRTLVVMALFGVAVLKLMGRF